MASRSLGALSLDLILRYGGFEKGMDQSARDADKRMKEIEGRAKKFGAALGGALAAGAGIAAAGIGLYIKNTIEAEKVQAQLAARIKDTAGIAGRSLDQLNEKGLLVDVYFAYDVADLSDEARGSLGKNADVMKKWPTTKVMVEGHADARGTSEYNMALGERRASAIRDYLVSLGIAAARVTIVSKGEEEPVCRDDAESCWSRNRRGRFFFTAK